MKNTLLILILILPFNYNAVGQDFFDSTDEFLNKYHRESGLIDYAGIGKNDTTLNKLYKKVSSHNIVDKDSDYKKAFYINAYNISVIKQVVVFYPIKTPFDVNGFFDNILNDIHGRDMTLDILEKKVIIPAFNDPRIHFALVCAAKGCPKLSHKAFRPESVEEQLENITKQVMNDADFVDYKNGKLYLSKIFEWYGNEFQLDGSLIKYINQYSDEQYAEETETVFKKYDWSLNDERPSGDK